MSFTTLPAQEFSYSDELFQRDCLIDVQGVVVSLRTKLEGTIYITIGDEVDRQRIELRLLPENFSDKLKISVKTSVVRTDAAERSAEGQARAPQPFLLDDAATELRSRSASPLGFGASFMIPEPCTGRKRKASALKSAMRRTAERDDDDDARQSKRTRFIKSEAVDGFDSLRSEASRYAPRFDENHTSRAGRIPLEGLIVMSDEETAEPDDGTQRKNAGSDGGGGGDAHRPPNNFTFAIPEAPLPSLTRPRAALGNPSGHRPVIFYPRPGTPEIVWEPVPVDETDGPGPSRPDSPPPPPPLMRTNARRLSPTDPDLGPCSSPFAAAPVDLASAPSVYLGLERAKSRRGGP
ncbi:unnamed protein product [Mycena citricolor]|uniref:Uncharacterized protein n=1 Tax=Mycena citricolor TaxID=2018698 RepID=A0AAD2JWJ5_9AGAR|nr:unnamed protein product [Mycena citricolor]